MSKKHHTLFFSINLILPLIAGAILYYWFHPSIFLSKCIYQIIHIDISSKYRNIWQGSFLGYVLRYYCSDFLWAYSLCIALMWVREEYHRSLKQTIIICVCVDVIMEIIQLLPLFQGVFDVIDILVQLFGTAIATAIVLVYSCISNPHR